MTNQQNDLDVLLQQRLVEPPIPDSDVLQLLGLPSYLEPYANKVLLPTTSQGCEIQTVIKRKFVNGQVVDEIISRQIVPTLSANKNEFTLLNFLSDSINQSLYVEVEPFKWVRESKKEETRFFNGSIMQITGNKLTQKLDGVFMNIESQAKDGSIGDTDGKFTGETIPYEKGWVALTETKTIHAVVRTSRRRKPGTGPLFKTPQEWIISETLKTYTEKGRTVLTKQQLEEMGYTDQMLSDMSVREWLLVDANPETNLCHVALELQPVDGEENMLFPQVWINGKDDNAINYGNLVTPWGFKLPDFSLKICGHGDLTSEDLFILDPTMTVGPTVRPDAPIFVTAENPTLMGFRGKFSESRFDNENPPLIKFIKNGQKYRTSVQDGILTIEFPAECQRKKIGFHIALHPDTGKSDFYHVWYDIETGEQTVNLWSV